MQLSLFISKRYLFSKRNRNAVNIISFVSVVAFAVSTAALVVVLSVFNGNSMYIDIDGTGCSSFCIGVKEEEVP